MISRRIDASISVGTSSLAAADRVARGRAAGGGLPEITAALPIGTIPRVVAPPGVARVEVSRRHAAQVAHGDVDAATRQIGGKRFDGVALRLHVDAADLLSRATDLVAAGNRARGGRESLARHLRWCRGSGRRRTAGVRALRWRRADGDDDAARLGRRSMTRRDGDQSTPVRNAQHARDGKSPSHDEQRGPTDLRGRRWLAR